MEHPFHTLVRMLNPFSAPASIMGIFHPGYNDIHQHLKPRRKPHAFGMHGLAEFHH